MMAWWRISLLAACLASSLTRAGNSFLGPNGLPQPGPEGCHDSVQVEEREKSIGLLRVSRGICSGTLISPQVVLTAAHCLANESASTVSFTLASDPAAVGTQFARAERLLMHPEYSKLRGPSNQHVDLGLVLLESKDYGDPPKGYYSVGGADEEILGTPAQIVGYGTDAHGLLGFRRRKSLVLQRTDRRHMLKVTDGPNGERPCPGDSGAPILKLSRGRTRVVGVFSWSAEHLSVGALVGGVQTAGGMPSYLCRAAEGQFATWVDAYRDWIEKNRRAMEPDSGFHVCP